MLLGRWDKTRGGGVNFIVGSSSFKSFIIVSTLFFRAKIFSETYDVNIGQTISKTQYPAHGATIFLSFPRRLSGIINEQRSPCA